MMVGEAPGATEDRQGEPFVGGAGKILDRLLTNAGISRDEVRLANVSRFQPKGNIFKLLYGTPQLEEDIAHLKADILRTKPNVLVPLGNIPLTTLLDKKGIGNWRGSILWSEEFECKVIPTFHPANIMRQWDNAPLVQFDMSRIKEEGKTLKFDQKKKTLIVQPTFEVVLHELERLHKVKRVAFDLETTRCEDADHVIITACAFADNKDWAICIPFTKGEDESYWSVEEELKIMQEIRRLMEDEAVEKVAHNAQFDCGVFKGVYNIQTNPLTLDTMCAFHTVYPELPKSLSTVRSLYTRVPYYDDWSGKGDFWFWSYNAMDAAVCFEASCVVEREMDEFGVSDFYTSHIHPLIPVLLEMQLRGVKIDEAHREGARQETTKSLEENQDKLNRVVGYEVNVNSPKQLKELLYEDMGLPTKTNRKTGTITTNEEALLSLAKSNPSPIFDLIIHIRNCRKMISTYLNMPTRDGRAHTSYNIGGRLKDESGTKVVSGPETGRLSSSRSIIFNSGTNLQNIPHGTCRKMFIPDEGKILVSADLRQADAHIVAYLSEEPEMISTFEKKEDIHNLVKSFLPKDFVPPHDYDVDDPVRFFVKKHVHALNYLESAQGFAKESGLPIAQAREFVNMYFNRFPLIKERQKDIERKLRNDRVMTTPMGRKRMFFGRWGNELFKEACAYVPQSTVGDILNVALCKMSVLLVKEKVDAQLLLQIHDSFILQCRVCDRPRIDTMLNTAFDIPITIGRYTFVIPHDIEVGKNWGELEKIKGEV